MNKLAKQLTKVLILSAFFIFIVLISAKEAKAQTCSGTEYWQCPEYYCYYHGPGSYSCDATGSGASGTTSCSLQGSICAQQVKTSGCVATSTGCVIQNCVNGWDTCGDGGSGSGCSDSLYPQCKNGSCTFNRECKQDEAGGCKCVPVPPPDKCTIQGYKQPSGNSSVANRLISVDTGQTSLTNPYFVTVDEGTRIVSAQALSGCRIGYTACADNTICDHMTGSIAVIGTSWTGNCPGDGYKDLWWHYGSTCTSWTNIYINNCNTAAEYDGNSPDCTSASQLVTLNLSPTCNPTSIRLATVGSGEVCTSLSNTDSRWGSWRTYAATISNYDLGAGAGAKRVCMQVRNNAGAGMQVSCGAMIRVAVPTCAPPGSLTGSPVCNGTSSDINWSWGAVTGSTQYQIQNDRDTSFTDPDLRIRNVNPTPGANPPTTHTTTAHAGNVNIYGRVRVNQSSTCTAPSGWRNSAAVLTRNNCNPCIPPSPLASITCNSPLDGNGDINVSWTATAGQTYRVQISNSSTFGTLLVNNANAVSPLAYNNAPSGTYYIRMRVETGSCSPLPGPWNTPVTSVIVPCTSAVSCTLTANPASGPAPLSVNLTANVAGGSGNMTYRFDKTNDSTYEFTSAATSNTSYTWAAGTYSPGTWTARANVTRGSAPAVNCSLATIRVSPTVTTTPTPTPRPACAQPNPSLSVTCNSPVDGKGDIRVTWSAIAGATTYRLQISTSSSFATLLVNNANAVSPYTYADAPPGTYYVRVRAETGTCNVPGPWSATDTSNVACATPTPPPCGCTLNLSVGATINVGQTQSFRATPSLFGSATMTGGNVAFSSSNATAATVNPPSDTTSTYDTVARGEAAGTATIRATATGSGCGATPVTCTNTSTLIVNIAPTNTPGPSPTPGLPTPTPTTVPGGCNLAITGRNCIAVNSLNEPYSANVVSGNVNEVRFIEPCTNLSLNPAIDNNSPYITNATSTSTSGTCTIYADGYYNGVWGCWIGYDIQVGNCSPTNTPTVTPPPIATNTPTPTPAACTCSMVLQPGNPSINIGVNQDFTTAPVLNPAGCGVISSVEFTSSDENLVPICDPTLASCTAGSGTFSDFAAGYVVRSTGRGETASPVTISAQAIVGGLPLCSDTSTISVNPPTCTFTSFSGPGNLSVGDSRLYTTSVTASGGLVQIDFSLDDPLKAAMCDESLASCASPDASASDTDITYGARLTALDVGTVTLTADCVIGGVSRATRTRTVNITSAPAWWQASEGDLISAMGDINSDIPALCLLPTCNPYLIAGANPGVVMYGGTLDPPGSVSATGWRANTGYAGEYYNYAYFEGKLPIPPFDIATDTIDGPAVLTIGGASFGAYSIYRRIGDLTINGVTDLQGRKVILMVSGKLTINGNIDLNNGAGLMLAISGGNIEVAPTVTGLEGIYYSEGQFVTTSIAPNLDAQLVVRGGVVSMSPLGVILGRDLPDIDNTTKPAELFQFGADQYMSFPYFFGRRSVNWREVAP